MANVILSCMSHIQQKIEVEVHPDEETSLENKKSPDVKQSEESNDHVRKATCYLFVLFHKCNVEIQRLIQGVDRVASHPLHYYSGVFGTPLWHYFCALHFSYSDGSSCRRALNTAK